MSNKLEPGWLAEILAQSDIEVANWSIGLRESFESLKGLQTGCEVKLANPDLKPCVACPE